MINLMLVKEFDSLASLKAVSNLKHYSLPQWLNRSLLSATISSMSGSVIIPSSSSERNLV